MKAPDPSLTAQRLHTPRAAAAAGIAFAILYGASILLIQLSAPDAVSDPDAWILTRSRQIGLAFSLVPFAGIAFLWFLGVMRERLGHLEDQFFSTLFLGSGLLYLAMTFAASASAGGVMVVYAADPERFAGVAAVPILLSISQTFNNIYAVRMAGMLMLILGTIWTRTQVMPRWLTLITYLLALLLLVSIGFNSLAVLVFPAWVLLVSVYMVLQSRRPGDLGDRQ
ncbi:MAG: hypothetical protein HC802_22285 [Caldilineaceae bacterium]|nr:hypothetical protein [Caldilineaceae bacterium]